MADPGASRERDGSNLFARKHSLRWPTERRALWLTSIFAPATIAVVGLVLPEHFTAQQIASLIVVAMVYVTIVRGRLLGTSIRSHEQQLPEIHAIVTRCSNLLGVPMPHVFVRDDLFVCITGMGLGQPYSIALSSQWLDRLEEDELTFLIGSELGHIAAGHTRLASLFSASGHENPLVALVFGAWLRRTEYTADRIGLLCCGSLDAAIRAIFKCSFHPLASRVSYVAFADQRRELEVDPALRMGEWLGESPYAVNRLRELQRFRESPLYAYWRAEFDRRACENDSLPGVRPQETWVPKDAGIFQRGLAFFVDYIVVSTITSGVGLITTSTPVMGKNAPPIDTTDSMEQAFNAWLKAHNMTLTLSLDSVSTTLLVLLYSAVLVAFTGRTFGMMIFGLRVVRSNLERVSAARAVWRYLLAFVSFVTFIPLLVGLFSGRLLHDRLSGTRVVRGGA
jgi:Zn-dependent protease with chaperone function/uncharacterized RDD family membrane protein YckC